MLGTGARGGGVWDAGVAAAGVRLQLGVKGFGWFRAWVGVCEAGSVWCSSGCAHSGATTGCSGGSEGE